MTVRWQCRRTGAWNNCPLCRPTYSAIPREVIYLTAGYQDKDRVKALGAKYDGTKKKWYVTEGTNLKPFTQWLHPAIYLNSRYEERHQVKALGAHYDPIRRDWYILPGQNAIPFAKWLPRVRQEMTNPIVQSVDAVPPVQEVEPPRQVGATYEEFMEAIQYADDMNKPQVEKVEEKVVVPAMAKSKNLSIF